MRITKYRLEQAENIPCLVKEQAQIYACSDKGIGSPETAVDILCKVFGAHRQAEEHIYLLCRNGAGKCVGVFDMSNGEWVKMKRGE